MCRRKRRAFKKFIRSFDAERKLTYELIDHERIAHAWNDKDPEGPGVLREERKYFIELPTSYYSAITSTRLKRLWNCPLFRDKPNKMRMSALFTSDQGLIRLKVEEDMAVVNEVIPRRRGR